MNIFTIIIKKKAHILSRKKWGESFVFVFVNGLVEGWNRCELDVTWRRDLSGKGQVGLVPTFQQMGRGEVSKTPAD